MSKHDEIEGAEYWFEVAGNHRHERDEARAEIERLRAALKEVESFKITDGDGREVCEDSVHEIRKIARAARASQ